MSIDEVIASLVFIIGLLQARLVPNQVTATYFGPINFEFRR